MILLLLGCVFDSDNPLFEDKDKDGVTQYDGDCFDAEPGLQDPFVHEEVGYATLAEAVFAANDGDTVYVCGGNWEEPLQTSTRVNLVGKGARPAVLDGGGSGSTVRLQAGGSLENLVITGGTGTSLSGSRLGGGVFVDEGDLTLRGCTLRDNVADEGAGFDVAGGTVIIEDTTVRGNTASGLGGGGVIVLGSAVISGSTFETNGAEFGGGLAVQQADISVSGGSFTANTASEMGGAMAVLDDSEVGVDGATFVDNTPQDIYLQSGNRSETTDAPGDSFTCETSGTPACN